MEMIATHRGITPGPSQTPTVRQLSRCRSVASEPCTVPHKTHIRISPPRGPLPLKELVGEEHRGPLPLKELTGDRRPLPLNEPVGDAKVFSDP